MSGGAPTLLSGERFQGRRGAMGVVERVVAGRPWKKTSRSRGSVGDLEAGWPALVEAGRRWK